MTIIRNQFNQSNIPLFIAFFAFISIGMPGGILNIAWTYMDDTFNVSLKSLGILLGASTLGHLIMSFSSGQVINKIGVAKFLIIGSIVAGLGLLGFAISPTWIILLGVALIAGIGGGMLDSGLNTFVSSRYSTGQLNWLHAFFGVGLFIGPNVVTFWVDTVNLSWRYSYGVVAVLQLTLLAFLITTRHRWEIPDDETNVDENSTKTSSPPMRETLMIPIVFLSIMFFFLYGGAEVGTPQLGTTLFVDGRNVQESTASLWISIYWISFTFGRMFFGTIANQVNIIIMMRLTLIGATLGSVLIAANTGDFFTVLGLMMMGFSFAPMFATIITVTTRQLSKRHAANAIGVQIGFAGLGIAALPGLAGVLADSIDLEIIGPFVAINTVVMFAVYEWMLWQERKVPEPTPVAATD